MATDRDPETHTIIRACTAVHRHPGSGFLEAVYQEALAIELTHSNISLVRTVPISITHRGQPLFSQYRADFICRDSILVELKALQQISAIEEAPAIHDPKATGFQRASLVNFGGSSFAYKRFANRMLLKPNANLRKSPKSAVSNLEKSESWITPALAAGVSDCGL